MPRNRSLAPTALTVVLSLAALAAAADNARAQSYTMGGDARAFAMGGAGIALTQPRGNSARANPASLAFERREVVPTFPSLGLRSEGPAGANAASTYLIGGMKGKDALSIAAQYGSANSNLAMTGYAALRVGRVEVSANAVGVAHVLPNADWRSWAAAGAPSVPAAQLQNARTDIYAAGYYTLPSVAYGATLPNRNDRPYDFALGVRVKQMVGMYSHRIADVSTLGTAQREGTTRLGDEMGGRDRLTKNGIGADLGVMLRPRTGYGLSAAVVMANVVRPDFTFTVLDAENRARRVSILPATISAGIGYETRSGMTLAADVVDLGGRRSTGTGLGTGFASSGQQFRVGAEQRLGRILSLRGGYSSVGGATYGVGLMGVDVAFGKRVPLEIVKTINF